MVLYKRKPVVFNDDPKIDDPETEIWIMPQSEEVFTDYESYLGRYNFFAQHRFTDAVNGKSGLTFFQAMESERESLNEIDEAFPDVLKEPILHYVQFKNVGRLDELAAQTYENFKSTFFPGEQIVITTDDGEQEEGIIRECTTFPELRKDGQTVRPPYTRFFIKLCNRAEEALFDDEHIKRGRHVFTKQSIQRFLKASLQREAWQGAPWLVKEHLAIKYRISMRIPPHLLREAQQARRQSSILQNSSANASPGPHSRAKGAGEGVRRTKKPKIKDFDIAQIAQSGHDAEAKLPYEDLNLRPESSKTRPSLQFLAPLDGSVSSGTGLVMASMESLLEIWNTLNVHCEIYVLDSFTFDDFVDAIKFSTPDIPCELLDEMHCAVLKLLVDTDGKVQVELPDLDSDEADSSEDEQSEIQETKPSTKGGKSRLSVVENASDSGSRGSSAREHRASDLLEDFDWVDKLKQREFTNGGWQSILVGILRQMAAKDEAISDVLAHLCPLDQDPTPATVQERYTSLDVNLRIKALEMMVMMTLTTKAVRSFLDTCSEDMTETRKLKVEQTRRKKELIVQLQQLEQEKQAHNFDLPEAPIKDEVADESMATNGDESSGDDDEHSHSLRRGHDRALQRKRKRDEENARKERERIERAGAAKLSADQMKKYKKIVKEIENARNEIVECEEQLDLCTRDLREANVQRTIMLGQDRFFNRYYWFERNGMPFGGLPDSSTADYGYANARIWVQGPDDMVQEGFFELNKKDEDAYRAMHGLTVRERKAKEEGETQLSRATDWGYYDDPAQVDALLDWLDDRGRREKALSRELSIWREDIVGQMAKLREHRDGERAKKRQKRENGDGGDGGDDDDDDDDAADESDEPVLRVSTRHRTYVDTEAAGQRVLRWRNGAAVRELGHLHSEAPPRQQRGKARPKKGVAVPVVKNGLRSTRSGGLR